MSPFNETWPTPGLAMAGHGGHMGGFSAQQVPGLFVAVILGVLAVGREQDLFLVVGGFGGNDVPGVGGGDVGSDEGQLVGGIRHSIGGYVAFLRVAAFVLGGLG